jgi:anti-repressor protein
MNELITTNHNESGEIIVSGRELHEFLGVKTPYTQWFERMAEYGFVEEVDFIGLSQKSEKPLGGRPIQDHHLKIDMAKEISMLQRSDKGKQARQYFIQLEKMWNSPEMVMKRALEFANKQVDEMKQRLIESQPKVEAHDKFISGENHQKVGQVAKVLGIGRNKLFAFLRREKIFMGDNTPYQSFLDREYFVVKEKPITMGEQVINKPQTYVTARGVDYLAKLLDKKGA